MTVKYNSSFYKLSVKSLHYSDYKKNDTIVKNTMEEALANNPEPFINLKKPESLEVLFSWSKDLLKKSGIAPDVVISNPSEKVYQIHQYKEDKEVYFFTNIHRFDTVSFEATFRQNGKYPWLWNPERDRRTDTLLF